MLQIITHWFDGDWWWSTPHQFTPRRTATLLITLRASFFFSHRTAHVMNCFCCLFLSAVYLLTLLSLFPLTVSPAEFALTCFRLCDSSHPLFNSLFHCFCCEARCHLFNTYKNKVITVITGGRRRSHPRHERGSVSVCHSEESETRAHRQRKKHTQAGVDALPSLGSVFSEWKETSRHKSVNNEELNQIFSVCVCVATNGKAVHRKDRIKHDV